MSDDRDFSNKNWKKKPVYINFREYINNVISDITRGEDLKDLIKVFGMEYLEKVIEGDQDFKISDFINKQGTEKNE